MKPKYLPGNKVRIRCQDFLGRILDPEIGQYENMTGEVVGSTNIVGFIGEPWSRLSDGGERITIYHYTVKINDLTVLHDVREEYLEISQ
jgi:hypothetical protein